MIHNLSPADKQFLVQQLAQELRALLRSAPARLTPVQVEHVLDFYEGLVEANHPNRIALVTEKLNLFLQ